MSFTSNPYYGYADLLQRYSLNSVNSGVFDNIIVNNSEQFLNLTPNKWIGTNNSQFLTSRTLEGTTNQVYINNVGETFTLSLPQDIDTNAGVTFNSINTNLGNIHDLQGITLTYNWIHNQGITGTTLNYLDGVVKTISGAYLTYTNGTIDNITNVGITGTTLNYQNGIITGFTGNTMSINNLARFYGGISGNTLTLGGLATFNGGITGSTLRMGGLATFNGGVTGNTATFFGITATGITTTGITASNGLISSLVGTSLTFTNALITGGRLNLFDQNYSVRAESSAVNIYVNGSSTPMLNLDNNIWANFNTYPVRTPSLYLKTPFNHAIISGGNQLVNHTISIPDTLSADSTFVLTTENQTINGSKTFGDTLTVNNSAKINGMLFINNAGITANPSSSRTFKIPDYSTSSDIILSDSSSNLQTINSTDITHQLRINQSTAGNQTGIVLAVNGTNKTGLYYATSTGIGLYDYVNSRWWLKQDAVDGQVKTKNNTLDNGSGALTTTGVITGSAFNSGAQNFTYSETTQNGGTIGGIWPSSPSYTYYSIKVGKIVTLKFPAYTDASTIASFITISQTVPDKPSTDCSFPVRILNNGTYAMGVLVVPSSVGGTVKLYATIAGANFSGTSGSGNSGFTEAITVTYSTI